MDRATVQAAGSLRRGSRSGAAGRRGSAPWALCFWPSTASTVRGSAAFWSLSCWPRRWSPLLESGCITDRARAPRSVVAVAALGFAGLSLLAAVCCLDRTPLTVVLVVLLVGGCCGPALTGALTSQLSGLVGNGRAPARVWHRLAHVQRVRHHRPSPRRSQSAGSRRRRVAVVALATCAAAGGVVIAGLPLAARPPAPTNGMRRPRLSAAWRVMVRRSRARAR